MQLGGTELATTAPAPMMQFSPRVTPLQMIALSPTHAVVADHDFMGGADANAGADQAIITNLNATFILVLFLGPNPQADVAISRSHHIDIITELDSRTKQLYMPGSNERKSFSQRFQLGTQEVVDIEI